MSASLSNYQERIAQVVARIRQTEQKIGQPNGTAAMWPNLFATSAATLPSTPVRLLVVSKTFPAEAVAAVAACGQQAFGENYVQEGVEKILALKEQNIGNLEWHFIGPIQSNKTRQIAEHFDWVQSVDRLKIAERLAEQRPSHLPPLQILLQVNISGEATKSGFQPADLPAAVAAVQALPALKLRGLMAIPAPADSEAAQRLPFRAMKTLFDQLNVQLAPHGAGLDTLSLGMSADLEAAILEGSTMVRVGSAIFGERT